MNPVDERAWARLIAATAEFEAARPFPHLVVDDFLRPEAAAALEEAFATARGEWINYHHVNERKRGFNRLEGLDNRSRAVIEGLHAQPFLEALQTLSGVQGLVADPELDGGGLHETPAGGYLNVHTDFLSHIRRRQWSRQLNLLVFLNRDWRESYRGWLELWEPDLRTCGRRIAPVFNRFVIFRTSAVSFHGVPQGVHCPPGRTRKSLALYYFRDEGAACPLVPTRYVSLPGDSWPRRLLIGADRWAVYLYSLLKRYTPLGDRVVTKILRRL